MIATKNKAATPLELRQRVLAVRGKLPSDVRARIFERFPAYDTAKGSRKVENIFTGASTDEELTEFLESLVAPAAIAA